MERRYPYNFGVLPGLLAGSGGTPPAISSVNSGGYSGQWASGTPPTFTPDTSPQYLTLSRQGFDANGNATTVSEDLVYTTRTRQNVPNYTLPSASTVAFSDYVYSTDNPGCTNNSLEISPKPVANFVTPARLTVGNQIGGTVVPVEVTAWHRNARSGRQVACVVFKITDGTNTISVPVSTTVVSGRAGDRNPVIVYRLPLTDISTLTASPLIKVDAEVYPWIGADNANYALSSVNKSALNTVTNTRDFGPRYFRRDTARFAAPPMAYVTSGGNDGTGVWSTTPATAEANPFLTIAGARNALPGAGATGGINDGAVIRVGSGTFVFGEPSAGQTQEISCLTITRDPNVARSASIITFGSATLRVRLINGLNGALTTGALRTPDITVRRTGTTQASSGSSTVKLDWFFDDVDWDNGSTTYGAPFTTTAANGGINGWCFGVDTTPSGANMAPGVFVSAAVTVWSANRGVLATTTSTGSYDSFLMLGSTVSNGATVLNGVSGGITSFNKMMNIGSGASVSGIAVGIVADIVGFAFFQNVIEFNSAVSNPIVRVSNDNAAGNATHVVSGYNTIAGFFGYGRSNKAYDDGATPRTNKLHADFGDIHVQINTKGQYFMNDASRQGNDAYEYGVGCRGQFSRYIDANSGGLGGTFAQVYPGLGAKIGTSNTGAGQDPLFTAYAATTTGGAAGAGNGVYTIGGGSPAKSMLAQSVLSHDLAGNARPSTADSAGAYV